MTTIRIADEAGAFAEDKVLAGSLRAKILLPALQRGDDVTLDFSGVTLATQSFLHALISEAFRLHGVEVLDRIVFAHCTPAVRTLIEIVADYMQNAVSESDQSAEVVPAA